MNLGATRQVYGEYGNLSNEFKRKYTCEFHEVEYAVGELLYKKKLVEFIYLFFFKKR